LPFWDYDSSYVFDGGAIGWTFSGYKFDSLLGLLLGALPDTSLFSRLSPFPPFSLFSPFSTFSAFYPFSAFSPFTVFSTRSFFSALSAFSILSILPV
jgi:hypothetical protein